MGSVLEVEAVQRATGETCTTEKATEYEPSELFLMMESKGVTVGMANEADVVDVKVPFLRPISLRRVVQDELAKRELASSAKRSPRRDHYRTSKGAEGNATKAFLPRAWC